MSDIIPKFPVLVWVHFQTTSDGPTISLGQRPGCNASGSDNGMCGWASLTRLTYQPSDWLEAEDEQ